MLRQKYKTMKNITIILSIVIGLFAITQVQSQNKKDRDQFEVQVDGLGCPFCAYGLEKKFKEFKGIKDIAIDIETGDFSFTYPSEKNLSMTDVINQVIKAGYTPNLATIARADGTIENNESNEDIALGDLEEDKLYVNGMCGMCKARIEKATSAVPGVATASWNVDSKMLTVAYDPEITNKDFIQKAAANVGHDTKDSRATDEAYHNLHACCKYKRD